jgi:hypothetical protein
MLLLGDDSPCADCRCGFWYIAAAWESIAYSKALVEQNELALMRRYPGN